MMIHEKYIINIDKNDNKIITNNKLENYIKKKIFSGKIIIFKNLYNMQKLIKFIEEIIAKYFDFSKIDKNFSLTKAEYINFEKKIIFIQKEIKNSVKVKKIFCSVLEEIKFDKDSIFIDKISMRFINSNTKKKIGELKYTFAHRDTWASNLFQQLNWWFPLYNINHSNTLFICPKYFKKYISNNSKEWTFEKFKKRRGDYPSTPFTNININKEEKILIKINRGDLLCFSGHHLHGSNKGLKNRINIETRTISSNDLKTYQIPINLDSESDIKKPEWFTNICNGKKLT